jgi:hypothetical protein
MSASKSYIQKMVQKSASLLKSALVLTVPQAMRAANNSLAQSSNPALQMRVRHALKRKRNVDDTPPDDVKLTSPMPTVSTLSTPPTVAAASGVSVATMPTTTAETGEMSNNLEKFNKKCLQWYKSVATKMVTKMYYEEWQKEGKKKSAEEISEEIKKHMMELGHQRNLSEGT